MTKAFASFLASAFLLTLPKTLTKFQAKFVKPLVINVYEAINTNVLCDSEAGSIELEYTFKRLFDGQTLTIVPHSFSLKKHRAVIVYEMIPNRESKKPVCYDLDKLCKLRDSNWLDTELSEVLDIPSEFNDWISSSTDDYYIVETKGVKRYYIQKDFDIAYEDDTLTKAEMQGFKKLKGFVGEMLALFNLKLEDAKLWLREPEEEETLPVNKANFCSCCGQKVPPKPFIAKKGKGKSIKLTGVAYSARK